MNRGDIWWYEPPNRDPRPACVLTRQAAIPILDQLIIVPATRTIRGIPTEVSLSVADGLPGDCVLAMDNLELVPKSLLTKRITRLREPKLSELCVALRAATGCEPVATGAWT